MTRDEDRGLTEMLVERKTRGQGAPHQIALKGCVNEGDRRHLFISVL